MRQNNGSDSDQQPDDGALPRHIFRKPAEPPRQVRRRPPQKEGAQRESREERKKRLAVLARCGAPEESDSDDAQLPVGAAAAAPNDLGGNYPSSDDEADQPLSPRTRQALFGLKHDAVSEADASSEENSDQPGASL